MSAPRHQQILKHARREMRRRTRTWHGTVIAVVVWRRPPTGRTVSARKRAYLRQEGGGGYPANRRPSPPQPSDTRVAFSPDGLTISTAWPRRRRSFHCTTHGKIDGPY